MHAVFALLGWAEEYFRLMTLYNRKVQLGLDALSDEVEKRLAALGGKISDQERELLERALEEVSSREQVSPEALVELLRRVSGGADEKARCLEVLLADGARVVKRSSPRLRFSIAALVVLLYLEHLAGGGGGKERK